MSKTGRRSSPQTRQMRIKRAWGVSRAQKPFQCTRRLVLRLPMRYGRLRRGSCHGAGLGGVVPRDADALCEQEEHAAPRETKGACAQAVEDRRHGLFELLYRHGDGYSDCALQPPDHAIPRLGRARDLRPHHQRQHIRPVLRVQRRTGIPAHHFDEFRRGDRGSHPRDAAICAVDGRIFRRFSGRRRAWRARISTSAFL